MRAIIDGKMYNTDTADLLLSYTRLSSPFMTMMQGKYEWDVKLYKTSKGTYFEVEVFPGRDTFSIVSEKDVKNTISKLAPDKYIELFGEVEEG